MFSNASSAYERLLGGDFAELPPVLQRYFGAIPVGHVGRGDGRYEVAGPTRRWLSPIFAVSRRCGLLFAERGADVPFAIENRYRSDGVLTAVRSFRFGRVTRTMRDEMSVRDGLVDRLGPLEITLHAAVEGAGMTLGSRRVVLRVGALRIPLTWLAAVRVREDAVADDDERQRVDVRVRLRGVGEVFRYSGSFSYRIEPE